MIGYGSIQASSSKLDNNVDDNYFSFEEQPKRQHTSMRTLAQGTVLLVPMITVILLVITISRLTAYEYPIQEHSFHSVNCDIYADTYLKYLFHCMLNATATGFVIIHISYWFTYWRMSLTDYWNRFNYQLLFFVDIIGLFYTFIISFPIMIYWTELYLCQTPTQIMYYLSFILAITTSITGMAILVVICILNYYDPTRYDYRIIWPISFAISIMVIGSACIYPAYQCLNW